MDNEAEANESSPKPWVEEAKAWIDTSEKVTERCIDSVLTTQAQSKLSFATFAKGCLQDDTTSLTRNEAGKLKLYLCDSTRDRKRILLHLFCPLTKDIFIFKSFLYKTLNYKKYI